MKRVLPIIALLGMCSLTFIPAVRPVRPFIQLPGEVYPGTQKLPFIGDVFGGITNTFVASLVAWIIVVIIVLAANARSKTSDEVPSGFYNFFEMVIEGAYNFAENIAGSKVRDFFPFFMTFLLFILVTNWMGLVPGFDSIGFWEFKPHFEAEKEIKAINGEIEVFLDAGDQDGLSTYLATLEETYHLEHSLELDGAHLAEESEEELLHEIEHVVDLENKGDLRRGFLLQRAPANVPILDEAGNEIGTGKPDDADYTIVPYLRPGATDLNYTLAFAIIAMVAVQYYGFKYLGARGYLSKFFPFIGKGFGAEVAKNPIKAIDVAVGFLELVSEISKIISFAFRLLGNIFAGMVLLFVMAFLLPAANIAFFGLEFFVGLIQAVVFALLMLIFMVSATESHHGDEEHH